MTDTVESVLAEMRAHSLTDCGLFDHEVDGYADRLAAAHARELLGLRADLVVTKAHRNEQRDRAEAADVLLRETLDYLVKSTRYDLPLWADKLGDRIDAHLSGATMQSRAGEGE